MCYFLFTYFRECLPRELIFVLYPTSIVFFSLLFIDSIKFFFEFKKTKEENGTV